MAIKATVARHNPGFTYPVLRQSNSGVVVLFTSKSTGTVLDGGPEGYPIGVTRGNWTPVDDTFTWSKCTITLESED